MHPWLVKFCLAIFYSRLTTGLTNLALRVRIAYVLLGVTYIATALSILLGCQPMSKYWQINPDPGNICQPTISKVYVLVTVVLNVLTDIYLLAIPLPLLWRVNINLRRRITLMGLFSGAAFVIMASIIRAVTIMTSGPNGAISGSRWACRETFVSIVVSNLPIIQPLIRKGAEKIGLSVLFSSYARPSQSHPLSSREPQTTTGRGLRKRNAHPLSIPRGSAWGSDEQILVPGAGNGQAGSSQNSKEITVIQETVIKSEEWPGDQASRSTTATQNWGEGPIEGATLNQTFHSSINAGPSAR